MWFTQSYTVIYQVTTLLFFEVNILHDPDLKGGPFYT